MRCNPIETCKLRPKMWLKSMIFLSLISYFIYLSSVSRISSISELSTIVRMSIKRNINHSCKAFNETHFICLPNVFFIGASKCGTTSITDILSNITQEIQFVRRHIVSRDRHKEVHQFDRKSYMKSWKSIELAYAWATSPIISNNRTLLIHYTPHYLYAPSVPFELRKFHPNWANIKFIVILRDPIERAWSSYWFHNSHLLHGVDKGQFIWMCCNIHANLNHSTAIITYCML